MDESVINKNVGGIWAVGLTSTSIDCPMDHCLLKKKKKKK
jgi:hypothetical protein